MSIKEKLIKLLGGVTQEEATTGAEFNALKLSELMKTIDELNEKISHYDEVALMNMEELNKENIKLKKFADETKEMAENAMKAISNAFHSDPIYGFPKSMGYPGSVYGTSAFDPNTNQVVVDGRIIFDDTFSSKFEAASSTEEQMNILQLYMKKYGVYDTIGKTVVRDGAMNIVVGYNENNTAYELYYHMNVPRDGNTYISEK